MELEKCGPFTNYDGSPVETRGVFSTEVMFGGRVHTEKIYVVKGKRQPLLGRNNSLYPLKAQVNFDAGRVQSLRLPSTLLAFPKLVSEELGV